MAEIKSDCLAVFREGNCPGDLMECMSKHISQRRDLLNCVILKGAGYYSIYLQLAHSPAMCLSCKESSDLVTAMLVLENTGTSGKCWNKPRWR